jgi:hypothetical protein
MRIVDVDLALRVGDPSIMRPACLGNLPAPLAFVAPVIGLGLVECPPGQLAVSLVTLLATEHPVEYSRWFRFEVGPLWRRDGNCKLA